MRFLIQLILFLTLLTLILSVEDDIQMISDVLRSYRKPTNVLAYTSCWSDSKKINFANLLRRHDSLKTLQYINSTATHARDCHLMILFDARCPYELILQKVNDTNKFRSPNRWIIIGTMKMMTETLLPYNIFIDSEIVFVEEQEYIFNLFMPYKSHADNKYLNMEIFGNWTSSYSLIRKKEMDIPISIRRKNLMGSRIRISIVISDNRTKYEIMSLRNIFVDTVSKAGYRKVSSIFSFINATGIIVFTNTWGYKNNGSYNGMVGDLIRGDSDLAGTIIFINKPRLDVLEFLAYPSPPLTKFVFRQPSLSYQNNLFILPFKPIVWLCISVLTILISILLLIHAYWEKVKLDKSKNDKKFSQETVLKPNISEIIIAVISAISQQGSYTELKGSLGRAVMFIVFFSFVFIYTSYAANIVALLQSKSNQIRTLSDLLNSRMEMGVEDNAYHRYFFSTATEPVRKEIYQTKIAPPGRKSNFLSIEDGVKKLQTQPFAFHMTLGIGYKMVEKYFHEHEKCGLQEIQFIQQSQGWQTCGKNSPYKEIFKIGLLRNEEHGFNDRVNRLVYSKKPLCAFKGSSFDSVNMIDFYPVLLLLMYGALTAVVLLLLEILYHNRINKIVT